MTLLGLVIWTNKDGDNKLYDDKADSLSFKNFDHRFWENNVKVMDTSLIYKHYKRGNIDDIITKIVGNSVEPKDLMI